MLIFGRGTGILPVSCLFSGVELASCQFHAYFRAWNWHLEQFHAYFRVWNWHLASFMLIFGRGNGILPVSCLFSGGQDAHSTTIDSKTDATPEN
ncbi:hypothetical protein [Moorena sp. SIO4G3]|uniref:hypothetical protein n=1 Tax=Moorena sp. SIO4G3 TaxID=2607821 RepID=UPI0025D04376|nr:hypothetical protein [Moorena sp. SIO4G3]